MSMHHLPFLHCLLIYSHEGRLTCTGYNVASNFTTTTDSMSLDTTVLRTPDIQVTGDFFPLVSADLRLTCVHHEKPLSFDHMDVSWYHVSLLFFRLCLSYDFTYEIRNDG